MSDIVFRIMTRRLGNNVIIYLHCNKFRRYFENFPSYRSSIAARSSFRQSRLAPSRILSGKKIRLARNHKASERSEARAMN